MEIAATLDVQCTVGAQMPPSGELNEIASPKVVDDGQTSHRYYSPALFHIGYALPRDEAWLCNKFKNVRFVLFCGSQSRAALIASTFAALCRNGGTLISDGNRDCIDLKFPNLCTTDRYALFLPHEQVLAASHGIGSGSADIMFHEVTSLLRVAGASNYSYIRLGSCGGCGVDSGTLVVSEQVVNGAFEPLHKFTVLGKEIAYQGRIDRELAMELHDVAEDLFGKENVKFGTTMCCDSFYEGQARLDGALAAYSERDQAKFLRKCYDRGIVNFEMESLTLAAFCARTHISCAVVCAVLVNRLDDRGVDTPDASHKSIKKWETQPVHVAAHYVYQKLSLSKCATGCQ